MARRHLHRALAMAASSGVLALGAAACSTGGIQDAPAHARSSHHIHRSPVGPQRGSASPTSGPVAPARTELGVVLAGAKLYSGALVSSVEPGGPAAKAGVKGGEQIVSVGGHSTPDAEALRGRLARYSPGQKVQLVLRQANGRTWTKTVTLGG